MNLYSRFNSPLFALLAFFGVSWDRPNSYFDLSDDDTATTGSAVSRPPLCPPSKP